MADNGSFYGLHSWHVWCKDQPRYLKGDKRAPSPTWSDNEVLDVSAYTTLANIVAFLNVMNKQYQLAFRGQSRDVEPTPTILRDWWRSPKDQELFDLAANRNHYWLQLSAASDRATAVLLERRLPRHMPFETFPSHQERRVAPWSVIQHYELWPTPLLDLTTSLRVAASFALGIVEERDVGFLQVFALRRTVSDVMMISERSRFAAIRLSAVCPPETARPHLQEGLLAGNPNFGDANLGRRHRSALSKMLVAKFRLIDKHSGSRRFWDRDFPRHSARSLLPGGAIHEDLVGAMNYRTVEGRLTIG
jgi:hypothetical protein